MRYERNSKKYEVIDNNLSAKKQPLQTCSMLNTCCFKLWYVGNVHMEVQAKKVIYDNQGCETRNIIYSKRFK